jgi:hypothetical protein
MVTMWSVKYRPKPGAANTSATRSGVAGFGFGVLVKDSAVVILAPYLQPPDRGNHRPKLWPSYYRTVNQLSNNTMDVADGGWAPHVRMGGYALLLTIAVGFAVLAGWVWLGGIGIVLGIIVDVAGLAWLRRRYGAVLPQDAPGGALLRLLVAAIVLVGIAFLANVTG